MQGFDETHMLLYVWFVSNTIIATGAAYGHDIALGVDLT